MNTDVRPAYWTRQSCSLTSLARLQRGARPSQLINHTAFCLHTPSFKLRCQVADVPAVLCVISPVEGRPLVQSSMSEFRVAFDEAFRFDWLMASLEAYQDDSESSTSVWEWGTSVFALVNALTSSTDSLEVRCEMRDELCRRGLTQVMAVCPISASTVLMV